MATCTICKQEVRRYKVTFTPQGEPLVECLEHNRSESAYQPFKKYWDTNIAEKPVLIESDRQREKLMREQNLSVRPREHIDDLNHRRFQRGLAPLEE